MKQQRYEASLGKFRVGTPFSTYRLKPYRPFLLFLVLFISGCFGDGLQSTIQPESDSADIIHELYRLVTWIDVIIFLLVFGLLVIALVKFREPKGGGDLPKQIHGNTKLEILWTVIPAVILLFISIPTWSAIFRAASPPPGETYIVEAVGHQWWWEFKYPEEDIVSANELHLPMGRPVVIRTYSVDVIHSIWIPKLAGKIDVLPGHTNEIWFTPRKPGYYYGQCAEFCGTSHANMRFRLIIDTKEDFARWVNKQRLPPKPISEDAIAGKQLFLTKACIACHTIKGNPVAAGIIGPNLNDFGSRTTLASGILENTESNLIEWIQNPQKLKPGALMILPVPVSAQEAKQLAAYLRSPPET